MTWAGALSYVKWRSARTGKRLRLLHELEREKATRGVDGRWFPWGNHFDLTIPRAATPAMEGNLQPTRVGTCDRDVSPFGVFDMGGNASEWTSTLSGDKRPSLIVRGGAFSVSLHVLFRCASRSNHGPKSTNQWVGFRLVKVPDPR